MFITELIILTLTVFICALALFGIVNTIVINTAKDCRVVVQAVNENWYKESREELNARMDSFLDAYSDIDAIIIDDKNNILSVFPKLHEFYEEPAQKLLQKEGMVHFIDSEYNNDLLLSISAKPEDGNIPSDWDKKSDTQKLGYTTSSNISYFILNPKKFFKSMYVFRTLQDRNYIEWAGKESMGLHIISIYRTNIPNVNVCFKNTLRINAFQFNLICAVLLFLLIVIVISGIYEILKMIDHAYERKRVNRLVMMDTVTGGYNKEYFIQKGGKEISGGRKKYAVVTLRLEKYRNYCTAYGLKQGENLLEKINTKLEDLIIRHEVIAHLEKSDFALLLAYQNEETLNIRIRNIMNLLRDACTGQHLTFTAGICPVKTKADDINLVLTCAGLSVPKTQKLQDEILWFNDSMKEEQVWERRIEDDMEKALENHEFQVYLQPKYSTREEVLSAAEALVRWVHPVLGFISPGKFIPLFEKNGFILQLDDYMLTEVCRLQTNWLIQGKTLVPISVNVSRAHFAEDNLAEHICSIVDKYKVPHEFIELELTESAFFDDKAVLLTTVRKLKEAGFKVSMDDFGAGYSSLNSLKELPLDIIKLDAEFFRGVDDINRSNLIVGETITLAKKLGMQIVAEGIETREQVDFLAQQDCDLIQGFYFSKPLPVAEFEEKAYPENKNE